MHTLTCTRTHIHILEQIVVATQFYSLLSRSILLKILLQITPYHDLYLSVTLAGTMLRQLPSSVWTVAAASWLRRDLSGVLFVSEICPIALCTLFWNGRAAPVPRVLGLRVAGHRLADTCTRTPVVVLARCLVSILEFMWSRFLKTTRLLVPTDIFFTAQQCGYPDYP